MIRSFVTNHLSNHPNVGYKFFFFFVSVMIFGAMLKINGIVLYLLHCIVYRLFFLLWKFLWVFGRFVGPTV